MKCRYFVNCSFVQLFTNHSYARINKNIKIGLITMIIELNTNPILDHTEHYREAGLSLEFLGDIAKAVSAMKSAGYEPYDQLYGYVLRKNDQYITRFGGAREIVNKMNIKDIRTFLKLYKDRR